MVKVMVKASDHGLVTRTVLDAFGCIGSRARPRNKRIIHEHRTDSLHGLEDARPGGGGRGAERGLLIGQYRRITRSAYVGATTFWCGSEWIRRFQQTPGFETRKIK